MRLPWKAIGLAGCAGVAATGVVLVRKRRAAPAYDPDELRERLHRRLAAVGADAAPHASPAAGGGLTPPPPPPA